LIFANWIVLLRKGDLSVARSDRLGTYPAFSTQYTFAVWYISRQSSKRALFLFGLNLGLNIVSIDYNFLQLSVSRPLEHSTFLLHMEA